MGEAFEMLESGGLSVDGLRIRAFPFSDRVSDFIAEHQRVFVVEQNRDGQLRTLLINECGVSPSQLVAILHYDGTPITARFIASEIAQNLVSDDRGARRAAAAG